MLCSAYCKHSESPAFTRRVSVGSVQSLCRVQLFVTPWTAACQASLSFTDFWSLLKLMSIESQMLSNHLILCRPSLLLPSVFPSIRIFSSESVLCIRWPKYWSFSFSVSPSNEYSGMISFRIGWLDLLAVQGTLKSLFQQHSSKASFLWLETKLVLNKICWGNEMAKPPWIFFSSFAKGIHTNTLDSHYFQFLYL